MKKFISILLLVFIIIASLPISAFAGEKHTYRCRDGYTIEYYLDSDMNPYFYNNGQKTRLIIGLEHLKVTDAAQLRFLNSIVESTSNPNQRIVSFNYTDLSANVSTTNSASHSNNVSFNSNTEYFLSPYYKFNAYHDVVRLQTTNMVKVNFWNNKKISFTYYYYNEFTAEWFYQYFSEIDCTAETGYPISVVLNTFQYGLFYFWNDGNLESYTAKIWTTM